MRENKPKLLEKAKKQYGYALQLMPQSAEVHYNVCYLDMSNSSLAAEYEHKAYELEFLLSGLKDKLKEKAYGIILLR